MNIDIGLSHRPLAVAEREAEEVRVGEQEGVGLWVEVGVTVAEGVGVAEGGGQALLEVDVLPWVPGKPSFMPGFAQPSGCSCLLQLSLTEGQKISPMTKVWTLDSKKFA
jgi:hypothetical protein